MFPWAADKIRVIPNSVPYGFAPRPKTFPAGEPRILHIGTGANKNLERLAEALRGYSLHAADCRPPERRARERLAAGGAAYAIENFFDVSDAGMIDLYEQADMVAFVSLAEGFGMPIIEAQSIGRPVLTSNRSPMREVAGAGACLVDPCDVAEIRRGLSRIIDDQTYRERLLRAGFANAERFTPQRIAQQYAELYRGPS